MGELTDALPQAVCSWVPSHGKRPEWKFTDHDDISTDYARRLNQRADDLCTEVLDGLDSSVAREWQEGCRRASQKAGRWINHATAVAELFKVHALQTTTEWQEHPVEADMFAQADGRQV